MSDIVERLRDYDKCTVGPQEAADEVERLRAENEKLREALKPFANILNGIPKDYDEGWTDMKITVGNVSVKHLRAAAAAIRESGE